MILHIQLRTYVMVIVTISVIISSSIAEEAMAVVAPLRLYPIGAPKAGIEEKKRQARIVNFILMLMELRKNSWVEQREDRSRNGLRTVRRNEMRERWMWAGRHGVKLYLEKVSS